MGSDKALLSLGEQTLLERTLQMVSQITPKICIVGLRSRYGRFGEVVEDIYEGCGPLGGIHAALNATDTELNLMLSVDMPLMKRAGPCMEAAGRGPRSGVARSSSSGAAVGIGLATDIAVKAERRV